MKCLYLVSIFPALTETFVVREIRKLRQLGCEVVIGQLRPVGCRPTAQGVDDLRPSVVQAAVFSPTTFFALLYFGFTKPKLVWRNIKLVLAGFPDIPSLFKLAYNLLASMGLAYRERMSGIQHVRGHHLHSEAVAAMFTAGLLDIPYSFKCYTVKTYYPRPILLEVVQQADFIVADTFQVRDFLDSLHADRSKVHILRNAVALNEFSMRDREPHSEPPTILAVGRLDYKKGFHVLLSSCRILCEEGVHFRCVIVGDGEERSDLAARTRTLKLERYVELAGELEFPEVQEWYERATVMAVPSVVAADGSTDGLPTVIIEAFARGVPVVGSLTAGIPEIIHNGINGFVVSPGSPRELASRLNELLSNRDLRRNFAIAARHTVERNFDLDRNAEVLLRLMQGQATPPAAIDDDAISAAALTHMVSPR